MSGRIAGSFTVAGRRWCASRCGGKAREPGKGTAPTVIHISTVPIIHSCGGV